MRLNNGLLFVYSYSVLVSVYLLFGPRYASRPPPPCVCDCRCTAAKTELAVPISVSEADTAAPLAPLDSAGAEALFSLRAPAADKIATGAPGIREVTAKECLAGRTSPSGWPRPFFDRSYQQLGYFSWAAAKHASEIPLAHFMKVLQYTAAMWEEMTAPKETHLYAVYNRQPKVIIDVGANVGFFSVEAILAFQPPCDRWRGEMRWLPHATAEWQRKHWVPFTLGFDYGHSSLIVHAIEPKKENWRLLDSTLRSFCRADGCSERHNLSRKANYGQRRLQVTPTLQLRAHHLAVSDQPGTLPLYTYAKDDKMRNNFGGDELASLVADPARPKARPVEEVEATTLDLFWERHGAGHPDIFVLKIDAERHELAVLRGAEKLLQRRAAGIVLWECSNANATRAVVELMQDYGYLSYLVGLRSLIVLNGNKWLRVFDRGLWANCASIARDHPLLPLLESIYAIDVIANWNHPKKYIYDVKY